MILTYIMILLALIHFYWALGGKFGLDKALPTDTEGNRLLNPSKIMTFVVGLILLGFSYVPYKLRPFKKQVQLKFNKKRG